MISRTIRADNPYHGVDYSGYIKKQNLTIVYYTFNKKNRIRVFASSLTESNKARELGKF